MCSPSPEVSAAADTASPPPPRSLEYNNIGDEGAKAIAEGLKENSSLGKLKYALTLPAPNAAPALVPQTLAFYPSVSSR